MAAAKKGKGTKKKAEKTEKAAEKERPKGESPTGRTQAEIDREAAEYDQHNLQAIAAAQKELRIAEAKVESLRWSMKEAKKLMADKLDALNEAIDIATGKKTPSLFDGKPKSESPKSGAADPVTTETPEQKPAEPIAPVLPVETILDAEYTVQPPLALNAASETAEQKGIDP